MDIKFINHLDIEKTKEELSQGIKPVLTAMGMNEKDKKALHRYIRKGQFFSFLCPCIIVGVISLIIFLLIFLKNLENISNGLLCFFIGSSVFLGVILGASVLSTYNDDRVIHMRRFFEKNGNKFIDQFKNIKTTEELLEFLKKVNTFANESGEYSFTCLLLDCRFYSIFRKIRTFTELEQYPDIAGVNISGSMVYFQTVDEKGNIKNVGFNEDDTHIIENINTKDLEVTLYDDAKLELKIPYNTPERALVITVDGYHCGRIFCGE